MTGQPSTPTQATSAILNDGTVVAADALERTANRGGASGYPALDASRNLPAPVSGTSTMGTSAAPWGGAFVGNLILTGQLVVAVKTVQPDNFPYTLQPGDYAIAANNDGSAVQVNLPLVSAVPAGWRCEVKRLGGGNVTIASQDGAVLIDGQASVILTQQYANRRIELSAGKTRWDVR